MENERKTLLKTGENGAGPGEIATSESSAAKEKPPVAPLGQLFRFYDKLDVFLMILGTIGAIAYGAITPAQFILMGQVTDEIVEFLQFIPGNGTVRPDLEASLTTIALWYIGVAVTNLLTAWMTIALWGMSAERQVHKMRMALFKNVINQEIAWFDTNSSGELNARLAEDLNKVADGMGGKFGRLISSISTFIFAFALGFFYSWKMTLVMMTLLPMVMISGGMMAKLTGGFTEKELSAYAKAGHIAEQSISSIRTVAAFAGEQRQAEKYEVHLDEACKFGIKKGFSTGFGMCVFQLVLFGNYALSFWYGIKLIKDMEITAGDVITVFFAVFMGSMSLGQAAPSGEALAAARAAGFKVFELINRKSQIDPSSTKGTKPETINGDIEFSGVEFSYPSRETIQILKDFNLTIPSGKRVALVGESGCGKSTVVKLIKRFYDPQEGSVLLDGQDIKSLNVRHLRNFIGVVNQEPVLFATTIAENIAYGREGVTQQEIEEAAKMANAHDFITQFPQGYETLCGERGTQLSGGQKQRIAIARALARNPKILLLDEATSALDTESEALVQEALDRAGEGRTSIIIAHRLSTVKKVDIIVAMKDGGVAEIGNHDELMALNGIYKKLVENQELADKERQEDEEEDDDDDDDVADDSNNVVPAAVKLHVAGQAGYSVESLASLAPTVSVLNIRPEEKPFSFRKLMKLNSPEWPSLMIGSLGAVIYGAYPFLFGLCFGGIFKTLSRDPKINHEAQELKDEAKWWAAVWIMLGIESGLGVLLQNWMFAKSGETLTKRLRKQAFLAFLRQDMAYFDDPQHSTGAICTRLASEVSSIQGATGAQLGLLLSCLVTIVGCLVIAFTNSWQISLVFLAFLPFLVLGGTVSMSAMGTKTRTVDEADAGQISEETLSNIQTVTSLSLQNTFFEKYRGAMAGEFKRSMKTVNFAGFSTGITIFIVSLSFAALFRYGGKLIMDDDITFSEMMTTIFTLIMGAVTIGQVASMTPDYSKAKEAAKNLFHLLDRVPSIDSYSDGGTRPDNCDGAIELENVYFRYPHRRKIRVLRKLNISAKPGQIIALVGSSGCGKSTSVSLVERFYDVNRGSLKVDGNDIKELNVKWLRNQIGIVSQEPVLFDLTVKENIAYGDTTREVSDKEIEDAAKAANIHDFISDLPKGYDTMVGDKGTLISGGQKQRIAIARALIRDPKILLLDEATSALDTESEKVVQEALDKASIGRTTFVIAHRLSTIQNADVIFVIKKGRVVEQGTHQELLALKGVYYTLQKAQSKTNDDEQANQ